MLLKKHVIKNLIFLVLFYFVFFGNAFAGQRVCAYIDPGTGSLILQMLLAVLFGSLFAVKMLWGRIKAFVKKLFCKDKTGKSTE
jgi:hydrogenase-4 membrane subunit HyfE